MQTANCLSPTKRVQLLPSASEQSRQQNPRQLRANIGAESEHPRTDEAALTPVDSEAETRVWRITSNTLRSNRRYSEYALFLSIAFSAVAATIPCFAELLRPTRDLRPHQSPGETSSAMTG
jgi:hypothetical protein